MSKEENLDLERVAAVMAGELIKHPRVCGIQLVDVPRGAQHRVGSGYCLLVVADWDLAEEFRNRLVNPATIIEQHDDGAGGVRTDMRPETIQETVYHLLGMVEGEFYSLLRDQHGVDVRAVQSGGRVDIRMLPDDWAESVAFCKLLCAVELPRYYAFLGVEDLERITDDPRVFNPETNTFDALTS